MTTSNVLALLGLLLGGSGGATAIARLTRLVVTLEQLAESHKAVLAKIADHEARLAKGGL